MALHIFEDLLGYDGEAYGWTQTTEGIENGDTLVAGDVVGFMLQAWPVAVTAEAGEFHQPADDLAALGRIAADMPTGAIEAAVKEASNRGLDLLPIIVEWVA